MPIVVPNGFPAYEKLCEEGLFLMGEDRAAHQDIRPLQLLVLNLMPLKIVTETQILRLLSNALIQQEITFLHPASHESKHTNPGHLKMFYKTFEEIKNRRFDGMIITGAPVEHLEFEAVDYWEELGEILDYAHENVTSTLMICWGAQAGLHHYYGIGKKSLDKKCFGVFEHLVKKPGHPLLRGFDDRFYAPHSRHTGTAICEVEVCDDLTVLATSDTAGLYMAVSKDLRRVFVTGHCEYDDDTLHREYVRDKAAGKSIDLPAQYYREDNLYLEPVNRWRSHGHLLFSNWLNYAVYQKTDVHL